MENRGIMVIFFGVLTIVSAVADFNWFMNSSKARFFVNLFGHNGARLFYVIL